MKASRKASYDNNFHLNPWIRTRHHSEKMTSTHKATYSRRINAANDRSYVLTRLSRPLSSYLITLIQSFYWVPMSVRLISFISTSSCLVSFHFFPSSCAERTQKRRLNFAKLRTPISHNACSECIQDQRKPPADI